MKGYKIAILLFILGGLFVCLTWNNNKNSHNEHMNLYIQISAERIENTINRSLEGGILLESIVRHLESAFTEDTYNNIAADLFNDDTIISVSYMPNGVVKWIYPPTEDNNNVLGLNVFEFEGTKEGAYASKRTAESMISGPLLLKSGQMGLTVRTPVFTIDDVFWGFVSVVFDSKSIALEAVQGKVLEGLGYKYALHSSYNGENIPLLVSENFDYDEAFHIELIIADSTWDFYLYSQSQKNAIPMFFIKTIIQAIGLCSFLFIFIKVLQKRQLKIHEQIYLDPLTKLFNRKKLDMLILSENKHKKEAFTVFYMDLNRFKPVNDTYGHLIGDKLLIALASRLSQRFDFETAKVRIGGDEFVLIIDKELDEINAKKVKDRIVALTEEVFYIDDLEIYISSSVGYACYPKDAPTISAALEKADKMMYEEKQRRRSNDSKNNNQ